MSEQNTMHQIKHKILVLSGKGGVGKSTISTQLAVALTRAGKKVGLLDIDLCGPSIPQMLGLQSKKIHQSTTLGWVPVFADANQRLSVMSIGFLLNDKSTAIVWRGPKKTATIKQFIEDVYWGDVDYLIIDTPPGTSDEHISICEYLQSYNIDGAILITTPQGVSLVDVSKEITFCRKVNVDLLGLVENMSGFVCPHCSECTNIFSTGGGEALASQYDIPFIGRIPIDPELTLALENGQSFEEKFPHSPTLNPIHDFVTKLIERNESQNNDESKSDDNK